MDFSDGPNPYESPIIRAELADRPRHKLPAKKRQPLLALLFFILGLPFMIGGTCLFFGMSYAAMQHPESSSSYSIVPALAVLFFFMVACWVVPAMSVREWVQYLRSR